MIPSGTNALARCGRVSVEYCRILAGGVGAARLTDSFTDSGRSDRRNSLIFNEMKLEPTVRIELTTRALRKRCSTD
jgi:hypothetical protein